MKPAPKLVKILIKKQNMERIIVPNGMSKYLSEVFQRSQPFVRKALRGQTSHPDAIKIREFAQKKISELT